MPLEHDFNIVSVCPHCGVVMDGMAAMNHEHQPEDGNVTICMDCGLISVVDLSVEGLLRKPFPIERSEILRDPDIQRALVAWQIVDRARKGR
jgi:hypothetical protein